MLCNAKLIKIQMETNLNALHTEIKQDHQVTLEWALPPQPPDDETK